ncbi:PQQ-dependent sugar dehydrogenase [Halobaculum gomorrense]|uniref:Glucose/arabinose dehydrogenase, beta-propeller fold n=1 Tax=Halobaculum gomorrense TaxID=43928 RepID=A0A1M5Q683_9EURY|nr:PQQ-dependent sugar dehydrogenase [Halobaculum gomorrense]SHH09482.1 Glucose/arabinose dehydrogenase, beta-propeller fold [Halobaculum gomorrense]
MDGSERDPSFDRRAFLRRTGVASTLAATALAGCVSAPSGDDAPRNATRSTDADGTQSDGTAQSDDGDTGSGPDTLATELVADGFTAPLGVEAPAGVDGRLYVVDQRGTVTVVNGGDRSTFLDVADRLAGAGGEMGLLGLAFHPDFPEEDRVYVRYSGPLCDDMPSDYSHAFVLSEFRATPDAAAASSERVLLAIAEPQSNHNAGSVAFGPDGLLYVGVGDGGAGGDRGVGHVEDWYDAVSGGNGQDVTENLLGSVLRIDPLGSDGDPYGVPDGNPLVGATGLPEQYAWGFRNPWRFSFDRETGDFLVADVGQNRYEEVNRVEAGGNYGWNVREGFHPFDAAEAPTETPDGDRLLDPVIEYPHSGDTAVTGISVIGGHVYRGDAVADLAGTYVFGDYRPGGDLFLADPRESGRWPTRAVPTAGLAGGLLSFGEGPDGALYVCTVGDGGGSVRRIVEG